MERMAYPVWYKVEQLAWPTDWSGLFGRAAPLIIEIGFGSGLFLVDLARRQTSSNVLGLEISLPALRNAARKLERSGLENVALLQAGARAALQVLCEPNSVRAVYINFPDPWPKKGHLNRRLISDDFLCLLASRMAPGGKLDIATDHKDYADQISASLARSNYFENRLNVSYALEDPDRVQTKYERLALGQERPPRYFKWRRNSVPVTELYPIPEEFPMPHVVMRLPANLGDIGRIIRPGSFEQEGRIIRFVEVYQSLHTGKLLIETYINEEPVLQRIGLEMRARSSGEVVISLAEVGFPRPTRGVHLAIRYLVERIQDAYPSMVIVHTTLQEEHADHLQ